MSSSAAEADVAAMLSSSTAEAAEALSSSTSLGTSISEEGVQDLWDMLTDCQFFRTAEHELPSKSREGQEADRRESKHRSISSFLQRLKTSQAHDDDSEEDHSRRPAPPAPRVDRSRSPPHHAPAAEEAKTHCIRELGRIHKISEIDVNSLLLFQDFGAMRDHATAQVERVAEVCCQCKFYVGICCSPYARWCGRIDDLQEHSYDGHRKSWQEMLLLCAGTAAVTSSLEKQLISFISSTPSLKVRCLNRSKGGERCGPRGGGSFLYVVFGRHSVGAAPW